MSVEFVVGPRAWESNENCIGLYVLIHSLSIPLLTHCLFQGVDARVSLEYRIMLQILDLVDDLAWKNCLPLLSVSDMLSLQKTVINYIHRFRHLLWSRCSLNDVNVSCTCL